MRCGGSDQASRLSPAIAKRYVHYVVYRLLANALLMLHASFVAFVALALPLVLIGGVRGWRWARNFWLRIAHLIAIAIVVSQAWLGVSCPLTVWENSLRRRAGQEPYEHGFIASWLHRIVFFDIEPWIFTLAYTAFGLAIVMAWVFVRPRGPRQSWPLLR